MDEKTHGAGRGDSPLEPISDDAGVPPYGIPDDAVDGVAPPEFSASETWADELDEPPPSGPSPAAVELHDELLRHLAGHDKPAFVRAAVEAVSREALVIESLYRDVLTPLLVDIGGRWQYGRLAVWEEHMAASMVRTVVEILYPGVLKRKAEIASAGRTVLLAAPPEEQHDLGLRMIADRFDMAGWTTHFLGADSPIDDIIAAARVLAVDAVVLSSATHYHRLALRGYVDRLERELDHVHVWVGGSAFASAEGWASYEVRDVETLLREYTPRPRPSRAPRTEE